ncbi:nucleic acid-binding protein [Candidatus Poriferisodalis sp.]|uniref:nucleic acid-binding protein n=1 Tax=Candidatus Poriferisodalis sp. TaxID=3101277 RepID=UPI003B01DF5A
MVIVLDSGPLGLLSNPTPRGPGNDAWEWARAHAAAGASIVLPEIADYEVRRELVRAGRAAGLARLDELRAALSYAPLSTPVMRDAASLWAEARNSGYPTAHQAALDGDVLLAAQARSVAAADPAQWVVTATTNVAHLERFVEAKHWTEI